MEVLKKLKEFCVLFSLGARDKRVKGAGRGFLKADHNLEVLWTFNNLSRIALGLKFQAMVGGTQFGKGG